jgi:hypothetical protein
MSGRAYLCLQQRQKTTTNERLAVKRWAEMMRRVAARGYIGDGNQGAEGIIIERVGGKKVLVLVVTSRSPEVSNLLGTDLRVDLMRRALQWRSGDLQNGQGWSVVGERLSNT